MPRDKTVRVSESELQALKTYKDEEYDAYVPLGFVVGELASDATDD